MNEIKIKFKTLKNGNIKCINEYPTNVPIEDLTFALHSALEEFKKMIKAKYSSEEFEENKNKTLKEMNP